MSEHIVVPSERAGLELDEFLCLHFPFHSKGLLRRQVRAGLVLVDGTPTVPSRKLRMDQVVSIAFDPDEHTQAEPTGKAIELPVLYEDEHVLAVDKPPGIASEPERWERHGASVIRSLLVSAIERGREAELDDAAGALPFRPRLLHRLDKGTSGVLLVAKDLPTERTLRAAFESGAVKKTYFALVEGEHPLADGESAVIDIPVGNDARRSGRMCVPGAPGADARKSGFRDAQTRISVAERFRGYTWMRCEPLTGRTHQIRVHLAAVGFPLAVDRSYGRADALLLSQIKPDYRRKPGRVERPLIARLCLHAAEIDVPAPSGAEARLVLRSPLPSDLGRTLKQLGKVRPFPR